MRIAVYSPYFKTFGGGERYMFTVAETLLKNHQVELLLDTHTATLDPEQFVKESALRFDLNLNGLKKVIAPIGKGSSTLQRPFFLNKYDGLFAVTDGSIFYSTAKLSYLHFQVPFPNISAQNLWGKMKLNSFKAAVYNSQFTKNIIESQWPIKGEVIYPPVEIDKFKPGTKKKYILSVGRFFGYLKTKKHEVMIEAFQQLAKNKQAKSWSLHLAGSAGEGDLIYIEELKKLAKGLPVYFYPNISFDDLVKLYGESSIYWHAAGYSEIDPVKMEHFGITTVEAMAAGCVPIVINKGGQPEIVTEGISGYLWDDTSELISKTIDLIDNPDKMKQLSEADVIRSRDFSKKIFTEKINQLFS